MVLGYIQVTDRPQMVNYPHPVIDILPSHSPKVEETYNLTKLILNVMTICPYNSPGPDFFFKSHKKETNQPHGVRV